MKSWEINWCLVLVNLVVDQGIWSGQFHRCRPPSCDWVMLHITFKKSHWAICLPVRFYSETRFQSLPSCKNFRFNRCFDFGAKFNLSFHWGTCRYRIFDETQLYLLLQKSFGELDPTDTYGRLRKCLHSWNIKVPRVYIADNSIYGKVHIGLHRSLDTAILGQKQWNLDNTNIKGPPKKPI